MASVTIKKTGTTISCDKGGNLLRVLLDAGFFVDNPCNGTGVCGKCKVRVSGEITSVSPIGETEEQLLKPKEIEEGIRLSCMTGVYGDIVVETLQKERKHRVLTGGHMPEFERDIYTDGYGVAVDIGTTTVVMALIDLRNGDEIASASGINAQKHFGLDVLTRITYEYDHGQEGIEALQKSIVDAMNEMLDEMCASAAGEKSAEEIRSEIREIVVAANCTMTHMLLGVDARSIGRAPYAPAFLEAQTCPASEIGLKVAKDTVLYCLPQVSAYIGADIVAGAYVCELEKQTGNVLFIDIGTNGEIVLAGNGTMLSCSCAAGPALEGMNISCGMRAADGAVEDVELEETGVVIRTIGDAEPAGLCGSGILAAVRELIRNGFLKKTGAFISVDALEESDWRRKILRLQKTDDSREDTRAKKREAVLCSGEKEILVTQDDVRQVQLAKGAILSGFTALLQEAGITMEQLDRVLIAGQFGAHLPVESLVGVGILPPEVKEKIVYVGNSSKTGAYIALMSKQARKEMEALAEKIGYFELAETEDYERVFAACMRFPV